MARPRLTPAVRSGWAEIRALLMTEMENAHRFACREAAQEPDSEPAPPDPEKCPCRGCVAARYACAAVAWIDARLSEAT